MRGFYEIGNRYFFPQSVRVFAALVLAGMLIAAFYDILFLLVFPPGLYFIFCKGGTQIDFDSGMIRDFQELLGQKLGTWESLPDIEYISFHRVAEKYEVTRGNLAPPELGTEYKYKVNLIHDKNGIYPVYESDDREPAMKVAKEMAAVSGLRVFITDGEGPSRWMK